MKKSKKKRANGYIARCKKDVDDKRVKDAAFNNPILSEAIKEYQYFLGNDIKDQQREVHDYIAQKHILSKKDRLRHIFFALIAFMFISVGYFLILYNNDHLVAKDIVPENITGDTGLIELPSYEEQSVEKEFFNRYPNKAKRVSVPDTGIVLSNEEDLLNVDSVKSKDFSLGGGVKQDSLSSKVKVSLVENSHQVNTGTGLLSADSLPKFREKKKTPVRISTKTAEDKTETDFSGKEVRQEYDIDSKNE